MDKKIVRLLKYIVAFVVVTGFVLTVMHNEKEKRIAEYLEKMASEQNYVVSSTNYSFQGKAYLFFNEVINQTKIVDVIKRANSAKESEKATLRQELFTTLKPTYDRLQYIDINYFQFFLPNNENFLRMHAPDENGDNVGAIRKTVAYVNSAKRSIYGFEEGRHRGGFRYIFPLFDENKDHIGSVEVSVAPATIANIIGKEDLDVGLIVKQEYINQRTWDPEQKHFKRSEINHRFYNETLPGQIQNESLSFNIKGNDTLKRQVNAGIKTKKPFSVYEASGVEAKILTMIPIIDPLDKDEVVAFWSIFSQSSYLDEMLESYLWAQIFILLLHLIIFVALFKFIGYHNELKQNYTKIQSILNVQDSMTVITDGTKIKDVNESFLRFFGMATMEEFTRYNKCIQPLFVYAPDTKDIFEKMENQNWIKVFLDSKRTGLTVSMAGANNEPSNFAIHVNKLKDGSGDYAVTFVDITQVTLDSMHYQYQASHDMLTGAYNRVFFKEVLRREFDNIRRHHQALSIIRFDIDNFKALNDEHGNVMADKILKHLVMRVTQNIRTVDTLVRSAGDEFILLLSQTEAKNALKIAVKLRDEINLHPLDDKIKYSCSFGVASFSEEDKSPEAGLERSKRALKRAKDEGKNKAALFD
jgi:diguanylate cyclase (GGDEF)-like protein